MKLINEVIENQEIISEINESGKKDWFITGIYGQAEIVNNNNRLYPREVLFKEAQRYITEKVQTNRAMGELNHPESPHVDLERAAHRTVELVEDGNDLVGKSLILNTPMGQIIEGILEGGGQVAISSRALGTIKNIKGKNVVQDDLVLKTFDIVSDPGAPSAFMNGIMEGVEYSFMGDQLVAERVDNIKKTIHQSKNIDESLIKGFNQILTLFKG